MNTSTKYEHTHIWVQKAVMHENACLYCFVYKIATWQKISGHPAKILWVAQFFLKVPL
jgi:hypothetical protein